jgi:hypothetical protein
MTPISPLAARNEKPRLPEGVTQNRNFDAAQLFSWPRLQCQSKVSGLADPYWQPVYARKRRPARWVDVLRLRRLRRLPPARLPVQYPSSGSYTGPCHVRHGWWCTDCTKCLGSAACGVAGAAHSTGPSPITVDRPAPACARPAQAVRPGFGPIPGGDSRKSVGPQRAPRSNAPFFKTPPIRRDEP